MVNDSYFRFVFRSQFRSHGSTDNRLPFVQVLAGQQEGDKEVHRPDTCTDTIKSQFFITFEYSTNILGILVSSRMALRRLLHHGGTRFNAPGHYSMHCVVGFFFLAADLSGRLRHKKCWRCFFFSFVLLIVKAKKESAVSCDFSFFQLQFRYSWSKAGNTRGFLFIVICPY